jgi:uncharacterized membrane protein YqiK
MNDIPVWAVDLVIAALLFGGGAATGAHLMGKHDDAKASALVAQAARAAMIERARTDAVTAGADKMAATSQVENEHKNAALSQEVPRVITKTITLYRYVDAMRVLNNAAATGMPVSQSAGPVDDSPENAERVAAGITDNLSQCRADLERFGQLQDWIAGVQK